ncbi:uncharacterized protein LOC141673913 [Apium graveolens]|uniref:uncharacterized protein LOC141673913 n=1 Tax=Apium graveolens TaxID=4045 RepID=UPI003D7BC57E
MKDSDSLDDFTMNLNGLVTNIRVLGEDVKESYVVKKLLRAVPRKFLPITSTIEQFGDLESMTMEEAIGSLKAYEERVHGNSESSGGQLMLTEEEWEKKEGQEKKLLYTREEWMNRSNRNSVEAPQSQRNRGRDKSRVRCFNCNAFGHYAAKCRKPKCNKEQRQEVNISQIDDDEPALLLTQLDKKASDLMLVNESKVVPSKFPGNGGNKTESNMWYLDSDASNHMTGCKSKFTELNEGITGVVKFGDGSKVKI